MKIGIIGNYGATNIGDDAILTAILKSLSGHEITVLSSDPKKTSSQFGVDSVPLFPLGVRSSLKNGFRRTIRAIKDVDVVVLGGGGLFQDNYIYACMLWYWQVVWVRILNKPLFIYATGVGPLKTWLGKKLARWAYNEADVITVRDKYSRDTLHKIGVLEQNIYTTTDPAFIYNAPEVTKDRTKNLFVVSIRPWLNYNGKIISSFTKYLEELKKEKDIEIVFVCMQQIKEKDHKVIDPIIKKIGGQLYIPSNFSELIQVMQKAEFAIGMRYHFLIAAILTQTPILPVSYSPKINELLNGTPLEKYILPVNKLSADSLKEGMKRLSVDYNNVKVYQKARLSVLQERAHDHVKSFKDYLKTFDQK